MLKTQNPKTFAIRSVICFFIIMALLLSTTVRIAVITNSDYINIANKQSQYRINISRMRGTIYDCNMVPLTNNSTRLIAAILPNPKGVIALKSCAVGDNLEDALNDLKNNNATICNVNKEISGDGITFTNIYEQSTDKLSACHLIGYTDNTGHGVCGLQAAYDDFLYSEEYVSAVFTKDGVGNFLDGIEPYFENDLRIINNGVVSTIDINIQNIVESVASQMTSGCVIVSDAATGKIRAMASVPSFDINNISKSLQSNNSPMIDRAITAYSVGSIFKPLVAAVAVENGKSKSVFCCEGSKEIAGRKFRCHKLSGHGDMSLCNAIAQSCNCYFYNLSQMLGGNNIYKAASSLCLSNKIKLAENLYTAKGTFPCEEALNNEGALANISIGQGELSASPVALLNLYQAIAGDGSYYVPSVVEKTLNDGVQKHYDYGEKTRIMKESTAKELREYLKSVVTNGTGTQAAPTLTTAAGKTATAQTGRYYDDGSEITNSWFCGFFPADEPQYIMVVMSDSKLQQSTASIFAQIADKISVLTGNNVKIND